MKNKTLLIVGLAMIMLGVAGMLIGPDKSGKSAPAAKTNRAPEKRVTTCGACQGQRFIHHDFFPLTNATTGEVEFVKRYGTCSTCKGTGYR